jgi:electron transfer flavoprotein alpha/beta subunit
VKIVCLVKQVPRPDAIEFDPETKSLRREGVPLLLNPFDAAAVGQAVELKRRSGGGEVIAMTMGPPQAAAALQECLALGADRCIHLSDRVFALADTLGTSRTLALAITKEGDVELILCGRKTVDSETWQVPPETAAFLGWPHVTSVIGIELSDGRLRATRETDSGYHTYELDKPAVLSLASASESEGSRDGNVEVWTAADLVGEVYENDKRFACSPCATSRRNACACARRARRKWPARCASSWPNALSRQPSGRNRHGWARSRARATTRGPSSRPSTAAQPGPPSS